MKEKKITKIYVTRLIKELLEKDGYEVNIFDEKKFDDQLKKENLITLAFIARFKPADEDEPIEYRFVPENIMQTDASLVPFHKDVVIIHLFYHGEYDECIDKVDRFGRLFEIFNEGFKFRELKFKFKSRKRHPKFLGWHEFHFQIKYTAFKRDSQGKLIQAQMTDLLEGKVKQVEVTDGSLNEKVEKLKQGGKEHGKNTTDN